MIKFDSGSSEGLKTASNFSVPNTGTITFKFKYVGGNQDIFSLSDNFRCFIKNGKFQMNLGRAFNRTLSSSHSLTTHRYSVAISWNLTTGFNQFYIIRENGQDNPDEFVSDTNSTASVGTGPLYVGRNHAGSDYSNSMIEDICVYNKVLSLDEIQTVGYKAFGVLKFRNNLIRRWVSQFEYSIGQDITILVDELGGNNLITATNPPSKDAYNIIITTNHRANSG